MRIKKRAPIKIILLVSTSLLLASGGFFLGSGVALRSQNSQEKQQKQNVVTFQPKQTQKPNLKFFVMSFCPFGNQAESGLKPVYELLKDKVEWEPHYIVSKINLAQYCQKRVYNPTRCQKLVDQGYFSNLESCRKAFFASEKECQAQTRRLALMINNQEGFVSLHGRGELNQDIRELCAWQITTDKQAWWEFVQGVNQNCNARNVDLCWQQEAEKAHLPVGQIQECFNTQAIDLLEKELKISQQYQVNSSPTIIINETRYPPQEAYQKDTLLKIGQATFQPVAYRSPEAYKQAVCLGFEKKPEECNVQLQTTTSGPLGGECGG